MLYKGQDYSIEMYMYMMCVLRAIWSYVVDGWD